MNSPKYIGEPKSQEFTGWFSKAKASTHLIRSLLRRLYAKIKLKRNRMVSAKALRFQFLWPDPESGFFYFRSSAFRLRFLAPALLMAKILSILISGSAQVRLACSTIFLRTSGRLRLS
jgi:hypothetical protein